MGTHSSSSLAAFAINRHLPAVLNCTVTILVLARRAQAPLLVDDPTAYRHTM